MAAAVVAGGFLMAGEWEARVKILLLFRQMRLKTLFTMKNCHRQEELFYAYMAQ